MKRSLRLLLTIAGLWAGPASAAFAAAPGASPTAARLASADSLFAQGRFAAVESVATLVRADLGRQAHPDTVLYARACFDILNSQQARLNPADSTGWAAASQGLEWLGRCRAAPDTLVLSLHRVMAWVCGNSRRTREGLAHVRPALAIARRHPEWGQGPEAALLYDLGLGLSNAGEYDSALVVLRQSLEGRRRLNAPNDATPGDALALIGTVNDALGHDDAALQAFQESVREYRERLGPAHPKLANVLSRTAAFHFRRGNYADAYESYENGEKLFPPDSKSVNLLVLRMGMAQSLDQLGDAPRARAILEPLLPRLEALLGAQSTQVQALWLSLASADLKLGEEAKAHELFARVRRANAGDAAGTDRVMLTAALDSEAMLYQQQGVIDSVLSLSGRAEEIERADGVPEPTLLVQAMAYQMRAHGRRGEWALADSVDARLGRWIAGSMLQDNNFVDDAWVARSEVAEWRGRHADALAAAAAGARAVRERLLRNVRALSDRQSLALAMSLSAPLDQLLLLGAGSGAAADRRCWDEVARLRGLVRAEVARRHLPAGTDADSAVARVHGAWVDAEERLASYEVSVAGAPRDAAADSLLAARRAAVDEAERALMRATSARALPTDPAHIGLDSVLARLAPGQALVAYVQVPRADRTRHLFAFVARSGAPEPRSVDLGEVDALAARIGEWARELGEPDPGRRSEASCRRAGEHVRAALWDPVATLVRGARDVALVPEAPANGLPWSALPAARGGYLVEVGPRLHVLDAERELLHAGEGGTGRGLLAIGGVNFDRGTAGAAGSQVAALTRAPLSACDREALTHLSPLPGTTSEAAELASTWERACAASGAVTRLGGASATEAAFKRLVGGQLVVHVATHGIALSDRCAGTTGTDARGSRGIGGVTALAPEARHAPAKAHARPPGGASVAARSSAPIPEPPAPSPWLGRQVLLALAGANHALDPGLEGEDGLLTAEEVTTLDLRGVDWVVLSACHSGLGEAWAREGVLGMERAFHLAGARTVIASQWAVDDDATREWMRALYEARGRGATAAAEALAAADRSVLASRRASHRSTHPFYWAAFTASGE